MNDNATVPVETAPEALLRLLAAAMARVQRRRVRPSKPGTLHRV